MQAEAPALGIPVHDAHICTTRHAAQNAYARLHMQPRWVQGVLVELTILAENSHEWNGSERRLGSPTGVRADKRCQRRALLAHAQSNAMGTL